MSALARLRLSSGAAAMRLLGLPGAARRRFGWLPTVVTWHGVHDGSVPPEHYRFSTKHVSVDMFRRQLEWLARHYQVATLSDVETAMTGRGGTKPLAAVTFDDGYENNLTVAWPVLKALGLPATFFITVNVVEQQRPYDHDRIELALRHTPRSSVRLQAGNQRLDLRLDGIHARSRAVYAVKAWLSRLPGEQAAEVRRQLDDQCWDASFLESNRIAYRPLTWGQVRTLADEGGEIGSHTLSHPHLSQVDDDQVARELCESRTVLASKSGQRVSRLSYPHGSFDDRTIRAAKAAGYTSAYATTMWFRGTAPDPFAFPRTSVSGGAPFGLFVVTVSRALRLIGRGGGEGARAAD